MRRSVRFSLVVTSLVLLASCGEDVRTSDRPEHEEDLASTVSSDVEKALATFPSAAVLGTSAAGVPTFVRGELGRVGDDGVERSLNATLRRVAPLFRLQPENLSLRTISEDALGFRHARYTQTVNGLAVVGGAITIHVDDSGDIYAVTGSAQGGLFPSAAPRYLESDAITAALTAVTRTQASGLTAATPQLTYVVAESGLLALAWEVEVSGLRDEVPMRDLVYVNAHDLTIAERMPQVHTARNREVYSANNSQSLPGTLARREGGAVASDAIVNASYDHLGATYDCYRELFNRDSLDNQGFLLRSTVHYGVRYANAFWNGQQMVFGDGDGQDFSNLADSLDVTAHELTHGVTTFTANLIYRNESGALNEAMSDIFAAVCEARVDGSISADTWLVGEDIFTPGTAGDALRYMNNPTKDGISTDYYPERYTGVSDNGGVHLNSGIANLAFQLLVEGGRHPRSKTTTLVPGIGMEKAAKVFYRALSVYMNQNTSFAQARALTAQAATDLYGAAEVAAVNSAWEAVGVGGGNPNPTTKALKNGVPEANLSATQGGQLRFSLEVPQGATNLRFVTTGGSGDADLYVRFGTPPTLTEYDARPYLDGNEETVTIAQPQAGTYYVMLSAYAAFSGVTLTGSFTTSNPDGVTPLTSGVPVNNLSGAVRSETFFKLEVPAGATQLSFRITGGTGDADVYVRFGDKPTTTLWDYRPYRSGNEETVTVPAASVRAGTWYVMVRGYAAYAGLSLTGAHNR